MDPAPRKTSSGSNSGWNSGSNQSRLLPLVSTLIRQAKANPESLRNDEIGILESVLGNQQTLNLLTTGQLDMPPMVGQDAGPMQNDDSFPDEHGFEDGGTGMLPGHEQTSSVTETTSLSGQQSGGQRQGGPQTQGSSEQFVGQDDMDALLADFTQGATPAPTLSESDWDYIFDETPSTQVSGGAGVQNNSSSNKGAVRQGATSRTRPDVPKLTAFPGLGYCTGIVVFGVDWCAMAHLPGGASGQLADGGEEILELAQGHDVQDIYLIVGSSNASSIVDYALAIEKGLTLMQGGVEVCPGTAMNLEIDANGTLSRGGGLSDEQVHKLLKAQLMAKLQEGPLFAQSYPYFMIWARHNGWID